MIYDNDKIIMFHGVAVSTPDSESRNEKDVGVSVTTRATRVRSVRGWATQGDKRVSCIKQRVFRLVRRCILPPRRAGIQLGAKYGTIIKIYKMHL